MQILELSFVISVMRNQMKNAKWKITKSYNFSIIGVYFKRYNAVSRLIFYSVYAKYNV